MKNEENKINYIDKIIKYSSALLLLAYIFGFITWNYHLSNYGFFEYNLLQVRYLSAGFLPALVLIVIFLITNLIKRFKKAIVCLFIVAFLPLYYFVYVRNIFPNFPPYFGGAKPFVVSIIANSEQIKMLENFNIEATPNAGDKDSVETIKVCNLYQNNEFVVIGVADKDILCKAEKTNEIVDFAQPKRVIILNRNDISGFSIVPVSNRFKNIACDGFLPKNFNKFGVNIDSKK